MAENNNTVLVTGATGLLGRQIVQQFSERKWTAKGTGLSRADGHDILKVDITSIDQLTQALDTVKPQVVIHSAANKFPDKVDKDPEGARNINVESTRKLARLCAEKSILLIYISTDYVFPGTQGEAPYEADHPTNPPNLYGVLKRDGENVVLEEFSKAGKPGFGLVLRVPVLYGQADMPAESAVNVLMDSVWKAQEADDSKIKIDDWSIRYPTNTEDVGRVCHDIAVKYLEAGANNSLPNLLQFSSEDKHTKYGICKLFAEIMGLSTDGLEPFTETPGPNAAPRPYDCHLSTKALRNIGIKVDTCDFVGWWRREVRAFRK